MAAGFRLAGIKTIEPVPGTETQALETAARSAELLLLDASFADRLPPALLERYQSGYRPLVCVVPNLDGNPPLRHVAQEIRRKLGIAEAG